MDGIEVVFGAFGKGVSPAHQAAGSGPQGAKPTLDVAGLALDLRAAAVRAGWKSSRVGSPLVAARGATPVARHQRCSQVAGALQAPVTQSPANNLAGATALGHPEPKLASLAAHETPEFIEFQHVAAGGGQERVHEGGETGCFFPPPSARPACGRPRRYV